MKVPQKKTKAFWILLNYILAKKVLGLVKFLGSEPKNFHINGFGNTS